MVQQPPFSLRNRENTQYQKSLRLHSGWRANPAPGSCFCSALGGRPPALRKTYLAVMSLALSAMLALGSIAHAHQTKLSSSKLTISGSTAEAVLELNGIDLNVASGLTLTDSDAKVLPERLREAEQRISAYVLEHVSVDQSGGARCAGEPASIQPKNDHVLVELRFRCPPPEQPGAYRVTLFHEIDPAARHMVTVDAERSWIGLLGAANPVLQLRKSAESLWRTLWRYFLSGVEHIAIGYDHIAFLFAVIVLGRRFWPLFAVVTAFTVAHSITLSLAVLDVVTLPSRMVEIAIAASIVYVAAENFFVTDIRHRWWLTFAFGLIHGFGFASVLREYGLPQDRVVPVLAAFNVGVEAGQLLIVGMAVVAWKGGFAIAGRYGLPRSETTQRKVALAVSAIVLVLALYWLVQRFLG
jgi:hydrogenase/urease accessory protein HupE